MTKEKTTLLDGSRLIVEATVQAGADVFIGYPITPANLLFEYASRRFPAVLAAPDEITALQWMSGWAAAGKIPVTATSFPGLALMVEAINMAFMMELPMVIILPQRLGPSTGTATAGAQGDLLLLNGLLSGGYPLPVVCPRDLEDCWRMAAQAVTTACSLRCPAVLLTSKEMVMTQQGFDLSRLPPITPVRRKTYDGPGPYLPYHAEPDRAPPFLPVGNNRFQVRLTSSTHDQRGILQHTSPEAMANTCRLQAKVRAGLPDFTRYSYEQGDSDTLVVGYGITAQAVRAAIEQLRAQGRKHSLLLPGTLLPVPEVYLDIMQRHPRIVMAEENLDGQYRHIVFGRAGRAGVSGVNAIGRLITPEDIIAAVG